MANVPPPKKTSGSRLPAPPPAPAAAPQNMATPNGDKLVDLNFKVPAALHQRFKLEAVKRRMTMREVLEASFRVYLEQHPVEESQSELF